MAPNVLRTGSEDIELYIRTYYSLLRSSDEVQIKSLVETHAQMDSSLHPLARAAAPRRPRRRAGAHRRRMVARRRPGARLLPGRGRGRRPLLALPRRPGYVVPARVVRLIVCQQNASILLRIETTSGDNDGYRDDSQY